MTLLTENSDISYAGLIGQDTFAYNFRVDLITDMNVTLDGVPVGQGNFTMTGLGSPSGGNVILNTGLVVDAAVILSRAVPPTQEVDYQPFDAFPAETHEGALDKLTMLVQQNKAITTRSIRFPLGDGANPELPDAVTRADTTLSFDTAGNIDVSSSVKYSQPEKDKLAGIEANATIDQTPGEIKTAYESNASTNAFTDTEQTKLAGIESNADVTDATNVNAAGAIMHTDITPNDGVILKTGPEAYTLIKHNDNATTNPGGGDNFAAGYRINSMWTNTTGGAEQTFICVGDGLWVEAGTSTGGGGVTSVSGTAPITIGGTASIPDVRYQQGEVATLGTVEASKVVTADALGVVNFPAAMELQIENNYVGPGIVAYCRYIYTGAITQNFNIASITPGTPGVYTVTFTNPMADSQYLVMLSLSELISSGVAARFAESDPGTDTTTGFTLAVKDGANILTSDFFLLSILIIGNRA